MRNSYAKVFLIFILIVVLGYFGIYCKGNLNIFNRNEEIGKVEAQLTQLEVDLNTSTGKLLKAITEQSNTINTVQTKINLLSTKQVDLEELTTTILDKESTLKDMDSTTQEYSDLVDEISLLKVEQEMLTTEVETLSNDINVLLDSEEDIKLYDSLNELVFEYKKDLEKLKASYIHLKEMLSVEVEDGETNYKLNNVKVSIEKLEKKISLIDMQLGNMESNHIIIKAIESRLKSNEGNNSNLVFFNIKFSDTAIETYFKDPILHASNAGVYAIKENINISLKGEDNYLGQTSKELSLIVPTQVPMPIVTSCLVLEDIDLLKDTYLLVSFWTKFNSNTTSSSIPTSIYESSDSFSEKYSVTIHQLKPSGVSTGNYPSSYMDSLRLNFNDGITFNDISMINIEVDFDKTANQVKFILDYEGYNIA